MSKVAFSKPGAPSLVPDGPATPATATASTQVGTTAPATQTGNTPEVAPASTAVATVAQPQPPATQNSFFNDDSFDPRDLVLPRLNVVQRVGALSEIYTPGTLLLDGKLTLQAAPKAKDLGKPIRCLVAGFSPVIFVEKKEGGARGAAYTTEADVVKNGGTLDYNESKATMKPWYVRSTTAIMAIAQSEGIDPTLFPEELDGIKFALALFTMKASLYTYGAKNIKSARKVSPPGAPEEAKNALKSLGYLGVWWDFSAQLHDFGKNSSYIVVPKMVSPSTEVFRNGIKELLGL